MDNNYPPYVFINNEGQIKGILVDQWRLWQEKTGVQVEITATDWKNALGDMKAGKYDVIDTTFETEERKNWLDFGPPHARIEVAAYFDKDISAITSVDSLQGFAVAVKEGDAAIDLLHRHGVDNLVFFNGYEAVIQAAKEHKINVFVVDTPPGLYFLHKYGLHNDFKVSPPLNVGEFHRAVRKGNAALLSEIEAGFAQFSPDERANIEKKWFGAPLFSRISKIYLLLGGSCLSLIFFLFFLWNRSLRLAVQKRTVELETSREALRESEARYRELVEHAASIILRMDSQGRICFINDYAQRFFGYKLADVVGQSVIGTIVPETDSAGRNLSEMIADIGRHPECYACNENENICRDGRRVWIAWTNNPLFDAEGQCYEILCIGNEITERRMVEEALRKERQRLQFVIDGSRLGIWEWNIQTNETVFNETWAELIGYALEELTPCTYATWERLVHPDDREPAKEALFSCAEGKTSQYDCEIRMRHKAGHWVWILDRGQVFTRDAAGNPLSMFGTHTDITSIKRAEEEVHGTSELLTQFIKNSPIYAYIKEVRPTESRTIKASDNFKDMIGIPVPEMLGKTMEELFPPEFAAKITADDWQVVTQGIILQREEVLNGQTYTTIKFPIWTGERSLLAGYTIDLTDRVRAEEEREKLREQLIQAQKMESVGRLAGGVAHDFNNMLGVIIGHCEMELSRLDEKDPSYRGLSNILKAAEHSANLTRQLLAFARKQIATPQELDINTTVTSMLEMLRRLIGENIDLSWRRGSIPCQIYMDPSQLNQILVNLFVNARDAIKDTGRVTIETDRVVIDKQYCADQVEATPGTYVLLAVSDDGCGIDADLLPHLFEPFFTTKDVGKGTGLGLATVYGIVKQNKGFINVNSIPDQGTIFKIYLPYHGPVLQPKIVSASHETPTGNELVLVVEDEPMILDVVTTMLESLGYTVLGASDPTEAIRLALEHSGRIQLLITDVIMPEMNGQLLAKHLRAQHPDLRCLFMSGYTANIITDHGVLGAGVHFIEKPFTLHVLAAKVREVLSTGHIAVSKLKQVTGKGSNKKRV